MYGSVSFDAEMNEGTEHFNVNTKKFNKKEEGYMYGDLRYRVYKAIQSDAKILFSTIKFQFDFMTIPSGSGFVVSREKEDILKKISMNCIQNKDKNWIRNNFIVLVLSVPERIKCFQKLIGDRPEIKHK